MSQVRVTGPHVFQPFGVQHKENWARGRIYGVGGVSLYARIEGLTKKEAEKVAMVLKVVDHYRPNDWGGEMSERDKWIYELGQRHPDLAFEVSDAYIERRGKDKDEITKVKELNGELTAALRLICAADNMTEAKIAVIQANTLLQSEAAK